MKIEKLVRTVAIMEVQIKQMQTIIDSNTKLIIDLKRKND